MKEQEKALFDNIMEAIKTSQLSKEDVADMISKVDFGKAEIEALKEEHQKQLDTIGAEIAAMKESGKQNDNVADFGELLKNASENMVKELSQMGGKFTFTVPTKSIMKTTILPSSYTNDTNGVYLAGFGQAKTQTNKIASLFSQFPIGSDSHGVVYYTDQTTTTRNAAARSVGSAAAESALAWTVYNKTLESISDSIPVAKEMLSRTSLMEAEIRNFITNNLLIKEDNLLVSGNGTTPQLKGIVSYAPAFDSAAYSGFKPKQAALMDLIVTMATEIEKNSSYVVDACVINPADALALKLEKDANGNRINIEMLNAKGEMQVRGIKVVESASVTENTLVLGDFTKARRYVGDSITLEFGYNASGDFAKRIVTLLGNMEELLLVRNAEADAFLKSTDIATDITNITEVVA